MAVSNLGEQQVGAEVDCPENDARESRATGNGKIGEVEHAPPGFDLVADANAVPFEAELDLDCCEHSIDPLDLVHMTDLWDNDSVERILTGREPRTSSDQQFDEVIGRAWILDAGGAKETQARSPVDVAQQPDRVLSRRRNHLWRDTILEVEQHDRRSAAAE